MHNDAPSGVPLDVETNMNAVLFLVTTFSPASPSLRRGAATKSGDVRAYPALFEEFLGRGRSDEDLDAVPRR